MNWLIIILVVLGVVCVFGGGNDKRAALSVIEGAFAHTIEPDSSAFYQEVSTPVSLGQTNASVARNDQRAESQIALRHRRLLRTGLASGEEFQNAMSRR